MFKKLFLVSAITAISLLSAHANSMPVIGDDAPSFSADSTNGKINFPNDYKGNWVILFSHPNDFTPVCTTEFMAFENAKPKFNALNAKLVGLSVDNIEHHKQWIDSIKNIEFGDYKNTKITFPIIDDADKKIAKLYGMLQKDSDETKTVRAVFVIDTIGKIRAIIYYPQTTGRFIPEIERLLIALQTSDAFNIATPANWMPGDDVIVPKDSIKDSENEEALKNEGITKHESYLYSKKLSKDTLCGKLFRK